MTKYYQTVSLNCFINLIISTWGFTLASFFLICWWFQFTFFQLLKSLNISFAYSSLGFSFAHFSLGILIGCLLVCRHFLLYSRDYSHVGFIHKYLHDFFFPVVSFPSFEKSFFCIVLLILFFFFFFFLRNSSLNSSTLLFVNVVVWPHLV